jgi:hypothetical protein
MSENTEQTIQETEEVKNETSNPMSYDEGIIKVDLGELNKPKKDAVKEQSANTSYDTVKQPEDTQSSKAMDEEVRNTVEEEVQSVQNEEQSILQEITDEEIQEQTEQLTENLAEAITEQKETGIELPENIQKVVDFMNDTGGTLEDYVKLNTDYSQLNEQQLLREYYENTKPHLDKEDIDILMEDFSYDEELDDDRDIRKAKIAFKEEVAKAKNHLEGLKTKYYDEIKAGSRLNSEQQKAVEFFNRYNKENQEVTKIAERQLSTFKNQTEKLFSNEFKGFDFNVGEKKFRFKVNNVENVKTQQSDINNFIKKFLNENNEMSDAAGYHKSLFTAMNPDAIANHFYEQGKTDAVKETLSKAKNIDMNPRETHEQVKASNGWTVKSITPSTSSSGLKIRTKR